ncbi:hypothetical protein SynBIOSU31_00856 [Synechococcus sp. BIOS-U3-1]|nr:hypothetical protein SynBIOSU31_00856 [Synechococcus sp. BIOS-U3-1]
MQAAVKAKAVIAEMRFILISCHSQHYWDSSDDAESCWLE